MIQKQEFCRNKRYDTLLTIYIGLKPDAKNNDELGANLGFEI